MLHEEITKVREEEFLGKIRSKLHSPAFTGYEESMSPYYAAAGPGLEPGWLDAIIDPLDTRTVSSMGVAAASQAPASCCLSIETI